MPRFVSCKTASLGARAAAEAWLVSVFIVKKAQAAPSADPRKKRAFLTVFFVQ